MTISGLLLAWMIVGCGETENRNLMDAYMLGFQFWKGDLEIDDDSPTIERYRYYQMLRNLEDNPYNLNWDMELEKSW